METLLTADMICKFLSEKKANDIVKIYVADKTIIADYFVIATATSSTHVHSLADEVDAKLAEAGVTPHHIEGRSTGWIVLDFASVIVHIFTPDQREFYSLDKMWSDGEQMELTDILDESEED